MVLGARPRVTTTTTATTTGATGLQWMGRAAETEQWMSPEQRSLVEAALRAANFTGKAGQVKILYGLGGGQSGSGHQSGHDGGGVELPPRIAVVGLGEEGTTANPNNHSHNNHGNQAETVRRAVGSTIIELPVVIHRCSRRMRCERYATPVPSASAWTPWDPLKVGAERHRCFWG